MRDQHPIEPEIITIDDDPLVSKIIESAVEKKTTNFPSLSEFKESKDNISPIAFFVDIHLGEENGLSCIPELRKSWPLCPIIVITSNSPSESIREALSSGADDFICKPLHSSEVMARLQLRLEDIARKSSGQILEVGDISLDTVRRSLKGPLGKVAVSPIECTLLATLIAARETLVEKETLKIRCWGEFRVTDNALHRKLHSVRHSLKLASESVVIQTKYGVGFSIEAVPELQLQSA